MESRLTLSGETETVVRMYGQGFGDCFLIALPRVSNSGETDKENPVYIVIDSGVFFQTPQDRDRMRLVAESIQAATGGIIDLLIATHEHHDHLCGFEYAKEVWKKIGVRQTWVAWTENEDHPDTKRYDQEAAALKRMEDAAKRLAEKKKKDNPALALALEDAFELSAFQGGEFAIDPLRAPSSISVTVDAILDDIAHNPHKRFREDIAAKGAFCSPGEVRTVLGTGVDAYILGPPTNPDWLGMDFPVDVQQKVNEVYSSTKEGQEGEKHLAAFLDSMALDAAAERTERLAFGAQLERYADQLDGKAVGADKGAPFTRRVGIPFDQAQSDPFFQQHYFAEDKKEKRIDNEWMRGASRFALQMDTLTNNTSLVVAFRLPDERVLLFVGDAQVGNWLSWQTIRPQDWKRPEGGEVQYRPTANDLLAKTVLYKVGHHGSHNATVKQSGLERMPDGVVAFIPSSQRYPQEFQKSGKWSIPLPALRERLQVKCKGKVILPHEAPEAIESSPDSFADMTRDDGKTFIEKGVPIWRQIRL